MRKIEPLRSPVTRHSQLATPITTRISTRKSIHPQTRDNVWLLSRLNFLWEAHFKDVEQINPVFIQFGRFSRLRLGSIKYDPRIGHSIITITAMFKDVNIPVAVVDHTIAHELTHYTQGFSSPHKRSQKHPHQGGVVDKEMAGRGLENIIKEYKKWLKLYREELQTVPRRRVRRVKRVRWGW